MRGSLDRSLYTDSVSLNCRKPSSIDSGAKTRYFQCTFLNAGNSILGKMSNMQALSRSVAPLQIQPDN
jgi:hypothetical protein